MGTLYTTVLTAIVAFSALSEAALPRYFMGMERGRPLKDKIFADLTGSKDVYNAKCAKERFFDGQLLDHFDSSNKATWSQYYQENDEFFDSKADTPIVFLMIGGEGPSDAQWVCWKNYTYMEMAKEYKALVLQLEHRFFGNRNKGLPDLSTKNLQYLTPQQAIEDLANFIKGFSQQRNLKNAKWVAFGGSYPGSLAAWLRIFHPKVTVGNVASSASLWPKLDVYEYAANMESVINDTDASGQCYNNIRTAFTTLNKWVVDATHQAEIVKRFNITNGDLKKPNDRTNFFLNVFSAFQGIIQYTYDARRAANFEGLDIKHACDLMNDNKVDIIQRIANVWAFDSKYDLPDFQYTMDISYEGSLVPLRETDPSKEDLSGRGWMWLCCGNLGYMQTTDTGSPLWDNILPLSFFTNMCKDIFASDANGSPVDGDYVAVKVSEAQRHFGRPWEYNVTNAVLPNGAYDPWHSLGTNVSLPLQHQVPVLTPGAAHCSDMYPEAQNEPQGLKHTRQVVKTEVHFYLTGEASGNSGSSTPTPSKGAAGHEATLMGATLLVAAILRL